MSRFDLIATDLDRTVTDTRLRIVPAALSAIDQARRQGIATVLATGRTLPELQRKAPLLRHFDAVVAEGGGLIGPVGMLKPFRRDAKAFEGLRGWLAQQGVLYERGVASISVSRSDLALLRRFPRLSAFSVSPNRRRADVTLRGVNKGSALRAVRRQLGLRGARTLAFGDGENDVPLLQAADHGVAVRNAVPALKRIADDVTPLNGGRGLAAYLHRHVLTAPPASRRGRAQV
jgi:hydroxymethylpyrimidine pyrophosphatase-like HAD family hydrolase